VHGYHRAEGERAASVDTCALAVDGSALAASDEPSDILNRHVADSMTLGTPHITHWPMADVVAKGGIGRLRVPCGASGTGYVSLRGLIGSRRVPST
jgi:hypothetical protein